MKYVQAVIAMGLFGWLGYAVLTDSVPDGSSGSGKTRALKSMVTTATDKFGETETGIGLIAFGLILALLFLMRGRTT